MEIEEDFEEPEYVTPPPKASYPMTCYTEGALARLRAEVRQDALLEAARAECERCKNGDKLVCKHYKYYLHVVGIDGTNDTIDVNCDAEEIHRLLAAARLGGVGKE